MLRQNVGLLPNFLNKKYFLFTKVQEYIFLKKNFIFFQKIVINLKYIKHK